MTRAAQGVALMIAMAGVPAFSACNIVTGAEDVRFSDDDDGSSSSDSSAAATGSGGATAQQAATSTGAGGASTTATSSAAATSGSGAGPTNCDYPAGPYSVAQGGTVPPTISWQGFAPGSSTVSTISMQDLFDCDGTGGIDAIIIDTSKFF